ncbi:MAG: SusC/RagA family TonB-linked outer membrane protein [Chryseolinea sp.]
MTKFYLLVSRYLAFLMVIASSVAMAQTRTVTGKVTAVDDGTSLPGVNVVEKGTNNGTITGVDGDFSLNVTEGSTIVFSFVGYKSIERAVGTQTTIDIGLENDVTALSEVVVIGYVEVKKRDSTGTIATVKSEDFNKGIIASPELLIQGKTAGVQITSSSGEPGAGVNIRIRGTSSVRSGNNPLFVVDGVPLSNDFISAGGPDFGRGASSPKNPLNFLNPGDIESMDVLKDAASTAIYGSRGANGVVIVTTKSGKGKNNEFGYNTGISISEQAKTYDVLNAAGYLSAYQGLGGNPDLINFGADTNWQDAINRTAVSQMHNLTYSDSYKTGHYRASVSYDDQVGIVKNSGMERVTGRLNFGQKFLQDKLKLNVTSLFSRVNDEAAPITNSSGFEGDLLGSTVFYNPTIPETATNVIPSRFGTPQNQYPNDASNPLALLKYYHDKTKTNRQLFTGSLSYDFTKELSFQVSGGFDNSHSIRSSAISGLMTKITPVSGFGRAVIVDQNNRNGIFEAYGTYQKSIASNPLTVIAGYSYQRLENFGRSAFGSNFGDQTNMEWMLDDLKSADEAARGFITQPWIQYEYQEDNAMRVYDLFATSPTVTTYTVAANPNLPLIGPRFVTSRKFSGMDELQSFFARGTYTIGERFYFQASVRADGSTRFGSEKKYGIFPAASAKWRLSEEDFIPEAFDELGLRLSYGVTGNQEFGHHLYSGRQQYGAPGINNDGSLAGIAGLNNVTFGNPALQWEQTSSFNIGLDYGFFNNRLYGSIDVYSKNTTELLIQQFSAQPAPTPFVWTNLDANLINNGVEFSVNGVVVDTKDFDFNVAANFSYNKNELKNYTGGALRTGTINGQGLTGAFAQRIANNQPLYAYFLREWEGFDEDGLNAGSDTQSFIGKSALPKYNTGFSLTARYKVVDFSVYFAGQFGHYVYNNVANAFLTKGAIAAGRNVTAEVVATNESPGNSPDVSTRFLEKGDFLRMQNISLGYTIPLEGKNFFSKIRLGANGQNLWLMTDYSGLDPEVNVDKAIDGVPSLGIDYTAYPRAKTVTFTLSATF